MKALYKLLLEFNRESGKYMDKKSIRSLINFMMFKWFLDKVFLTFIAIFAMIIPLLTYCQLVEQNELLMKQTLQNQRNFYASDQRDSLKLLRSRQDNVHNSDRQAALDALIRNPFVIDIDQIKMEKAVFRFGERRQLNLFEADLGEVKLFNSYVLNITDSKIDNLFIHGSLHPGLYIENNGIHNLEYRYDYITNFYIRKSKLDVLNVSNASVCTLFIVKSEIKTLIAKYTKFDGCSLFDFSNYIHGRTVFEELKIIDADLTGAKFSNISLKGIKGLKQKHLKGACAVENVLLPEGLKIEKC